MLEKPSRKVPTPRVALAPGNHVGRYIVLELLAAGGMGAVYSAYDPKLDRRVAVKVLRHEAVAGSTGRLRLEREAQALARLSHPNVVAVHDVGEHDGGVFIAMELVEGDTLKRWLRAQPRSWRAIVDVFVDVGRGLAAAHAVGLVHRDVKPDNILVGADGRVRVTDFGLARAAFAAAESSDTSSARPSTELILTASGAVAGTPAYMAPEQFRSEPTDARTDQFAFCIALYEALYGERPFEGTTVDELAAAVVNGKVRPLPQRRVPARVLRCVRRGLRVDAAERYPSMTALIAELRRDRTALVVGVAASAVVAVAVGGLWAARHGDEPHASCDGAARKLAGVWSDSHKQAVRAAFVRTNRPFAAETYAAVAQTLDRYTRDWSVMHRDTCQATLRGEQSAELRDLRMRCLATRLDEVHALTDLLVAADGSLIDRAANAARTLPSLHECSEAQQLSAVVPPPDERAVAEVEREVAKARAFSAAGRERDAKRVAETALVRAQQLGYAPLEAKLYAVIGRAHMVAGTLDAAEAAHEAGIRAAERGRDDQTRAALLTRLAFLAGIERANAKRGLEIADQAEAVIARMGGNPAAEARLASNRGAILSMAGRLDDAIPQYEKSRALWLKVPDAPSLDAMLPVSNLAYTLNLMGRHEEAIALSLEAEAMVAEVAGPGHPESARILLNRGASLHGVRRFREAREVDERARAIYAEVHGSDSWQAALLHFALGNIDNAEGKFEASIAQHQRALDSFVKQFGEHDARVATALWGLGAAQANSGRLDEARVTLERDLAIRKQLLGSRNPQIVPSLQVLAAVALERGDQEEAQRLLDEARPLVDQAPAEARGMFDLTDGWALLERGEPAAAIAVLERAQAVLAARSIMLWESEYARFLLGRALWESRRDRNLGRQLVMTARNAMRELGDTFPRDVARVEAWLKARSK